MQSPMFVFAGPRDQRSSSDTELLLTRLDERFTIQKIPINFTRKDELLILEFEDVSFYIAFLKNETELKDWLRMADDFELTSRPNPTDNSDLDKRYRQKKASSPSLYKDIHYSIGETIFEMMNEFSPVKIYLFL